jgi:hypothetical protein
VGRAELPRPTSAAYVSPDAGRSILGSHSNGSHSNGSRSHGSRSHERSARARSFNESDLQRGLTTCRDSSSRRYAPKRSCG